MKNHHKLLLRVLDAIRVQMQYANMGDMVKRAGLGRGQDQLTKDIMDACIDTDDDPSEDRDA